MGRERTDCTGLRGIGGATRRYAPHQRPSRPRTARYPSRPLAPPWRASYARWRADATRAAQALPRGTYAQRRLERAAWELLGAADAIAEAAV